MAYPIKSTGTTLTNTIKTGNASIGVNQGGYGSTLLTGYRNGRTPNVGGYIVYQANGVDNPIPYGASSDTKLIALANRLGGGGITTIGGALTYFNSSSTLVCVNVQYSNIVTTSIGPNLDAGFTPSYPTTGTTWTDISSSGYTGTLINGVSYGSGSLTFDGSDDAVTLSSTITLGNGNWSVCMWVSAGAFSSSGYGTLLSNNSGGPVTNAFGMINGKISYDYYTPGWNQQLGSTSLTAGPWYFLTWVNFSPGKMLMYVNGVVDCALFTSTTSNGGPVNSIGRNWTTTFNGKISGVSIYQGKSLTPAEILQNYYAGLQRFIPTGKLTLWLDATNTNTRVITPPTAYDMSGNNNDAVLLNGLSLGHWDGGTVFSFDGSDDVLSVGVEPTYVYDPGTNVFVDDFQRTSVSPGGTPNVSYTSTITGLGAITIVTSTYLRLRADNTNTVGRLYVMSTYSSIGNPNFYTQLNLNPTQVNWSVNVRNNWNTTLSGFDSNLFGQAVILASSGTNVLTNGSGYALVYGGSGTKQWRLVSFTGGLQANANLTTIVSTTNSIFGDGDYLSLRVTYDPLLSAWSIWVRNDGAAWVDSRLTAGYSFSEEAIDSTYTNVTLNSFGYFYNFGSTLTANNAQFDNFNVYYSLAKTLAVPRSGNFTIVAWIKRNSTLIPLGDREPIFANTATADGFRFQISNDGTLYSLIGGYGGAGYSEGAMGTGYNVADGVWHQVGVMFDRTGSLGTYQAYAIFDGTIIGSRTIASTNDVFTNQVASVSSPCCSMYQGKLSTLSVYSRILTASEVSIMYNSNKPRYGL